MKINDAALTGSTSVKLESRFRAFAFVIVSTSNNYAALIAAYAACTVEFVKQTDNGTEPIIIPRKLTDILEAAAAQMGGIMATSDGANTTVRAGFEVSDYGTVDPNGNYYRLIFTGIPAGDTIDVYAVDAQVDGNGWHNVIEQVTVDATTPKTILCPNSKMLFLPVATTARLEIFWKNGAVTTHDLEELKSMCFESNEVALNENGVITGGFINHLALNVLDAKYVKVTLSAAGTVLKQDYKQL